MRMRRILLIRSCQDSVDVLSKKIDGMSGPGPGRSVPPPGRHETFVYEYGRPSASGDPASWLGSAACSSRTSTRSLSIDELELIEPEPHWP
jgi:hypothetical protein